MFINVLYVLFFCFLNQTNIRKKNEIFFSTLENSNICFDVIQQKQQQQQSSNNNLIKLQQKKKLFAFCCI